MSKKYKIELNIRCLYVQDPKYFMEAFKVYWIESEARERSTPGSQGSRVAIVNEDTQTAKFNDKFQMKTVLQFDEESQQFKEKPSILQVYLLEKKPEDEQPHWDGKDFKSYKPALTGQEIDLGETPFNLAKYAA